jgi:hypothetical protein
VPGDSESERRERYAVLLLAVLFMLFFSPLAWQMAYVWPIVPLALVLTARPPAARPAAVVTVGVGAALLCSRIFDVRVLDLLNVLGAAVVMLALMRWYLPLQQAAPDASVAPVVPQADPAEPTSS